MKRVILALIATMGLVTNAAQAADFNDDLNTLWEVLWDERGSVQPLFRWDVSKTHDYRVTGDGPGVEVAHIERALKEAADITGLKFRIAPSDMADKDLPIEYRFVKEREIDEKNGCQAERLMTTGFKIEKAIVKIRARQGFRCIHHETMHLLGFMGHPSGKTVLTYFPWRRDVYLPLDQTMLRAWYSKDMPYGAHPFKALEVMSKQLEKDNEHGLKAEVLAQQKQTFVDAVWHDMAFFAQGKGDVPAILWRSGRTSNEHMRHSRTMLAHTMGMSKRDGILITKDLTQAAQWFTIGAKHGFSNSQVLLAYAFLNGAGVDKNSVQAAVWFGLAAGQKNSMGQTQYYRLLPTLTEVERTQVAQIIENFKPEVWF